jgi:dTDP-6-deoxy-L-talose 4-dehydrogenase (NAD+)
MSDAESRASVLVTGAAGYVGRHVVTSLLDMDFDVVAVARPGNTRGIDPRARIVEADVLSPDVDVAALVDARTRVAVHLAWQDGFAHNAMSHMLRLSDHFRFLTALVDAGVPRLAPLGTMHEIGYWEGGITASTPTNPRSMYGIAKDTLRRAVFLALPETEIAWLRCYYIYGDDRANNSIFTRLLEAVDEGKTTMPFTTGKNKYDFIRVEELGRQIAVAATTNGFTGIINCSTGEPVSLAEKVEGFIAENRLPISLDYGAFPDRPYDSPAVWGVADDILALVGRDAHR